MAEKPKFHPTLAITNVKNLIPIMLDMESGQYHSWSALYKVQDRVHKVLDHIIPPSDEIGKASSKTIKDVDPDLWDRLDAVVLQWIYATISTDLLHSILEPDDTAVNAWNRLADMFNQFTNTNLEDFSNTTAYCQHLKVVADQLAYVGAPVSDQRMVLKLIVGLTDAYSGFVTNIQQSDPLPSFAKARSKIALEETSMMKRAAHEGGSSGAMLVDSQVHDGSAVSHGISWISTKYTEHSNTRNETVEPQKRSWKYWEPWCWQVRSTKQRRPTTTST